MGNEPRTTGISQPINPTPCPRDLSDIKGAGLWIFANLDGEARRDD